MRADDVEIGRPCPIDLRERVSNPAVEFHCEHCDRPVHVLSHMSQAEAARVLARRERDNLCVAFLRAPDGRVHFRGDGEALVPAARLGVMLRASTLVLSIAACTAHEDERVEPVDLAAFERRPPPPPRHGEEFEIHGGAPIVAPKRDRQVRFEQLEPRAIPKPSRRKLLALDAARPGNVAKCTIDFCVNERGRVVDAKRTWGDAQLAKLYIERMARWSFAPYEVEGRKTRVCTSQQFYVRFIKDPREKDSLSGQRSGAR